MKSYQTSFIILIFLLYSCNKVENSNDDYTAGKNSLATNQNAEPDKTRSKKALVKAYEKALKENNDTLRNKMLLDVSYRFLKANDSILFLRSNKNARELSIYLKDSVGISATYWDLAQFYHRHTAEDSAYYYYDKAQKIYNALGDELNSGKLLLNMAIIQKNIKDYTGSEVTTTNAITLLDPLDEFHSLYVAFNNLGIVFNELEEYDKALFYHNKALENLTKSGETKDFPSVYNNIGVVFNNQKKYSKANEYFKKALTSTEKLQHANPKIYAMILDNQAYARFHSKDTTGVYKQFMKALSIRKEQNFETGISINQLHLAEYFLKNEDTLNAIEYGLAAKEIASKSQNTRDLLSSLELLSNAIKDSALSYSKQYIKINDSLQKQERAVRNKFARIRLETDQYISETERLNQRILRMSLIALGIFFIFILLYIIQDQRSKNKLIKQKQIANQEIYNLILAQQKNFEEGREKEKRHISRELHDGILGKLFGVRLSLDSLNEEDQAESKKKRFEYIEEIQKIAEEIRLISHKLNKCSLIDVDFKTVLQEFIREQHQGIELQLEMDESIDWEDFDNNIKINIYRIIQEAITNIQKHAEATKAKVVIKKNKKQIILQVKDNGFGFNTDEPKKELG